MSKTFSELYEANLNTNVLNAVTAILDIREAHNFCFIAISKTGTHATHEIEIQVSPDKTNWYDTGYKLTGIGIKPAFPLECRYARGKVIVVEGANSTIDFYLQGK